MKIKFSRKVFGKKLKYQISWKSFQWEPSCSLRTEGRADGQRDMVKQIEAFRNFANALKIGGWKPSLCGDLQRRAVGNKFLSNTFISLRKNESWKSAV